MGLVLTVSYKNLQPRLSAAFLKYLFLPHTGTRLPRYRSKNCMKKNIHIYLVQNTLGY